VIVRELVTLLGFRTELVGLAAYGSALQTITERANRVAGAVAGVTTLAIAGIGVLAAGGLAAVAKAGDETTAAMNRLTTATGSVGEATAAYDGLYQISLRTGTSIADGARTFQRFAFAAKDLGASTEDTLKVVQTIQQAALVSGATTQESNSAAIQLGQALSSGVLQGDELRSLTENMPILAREMAKHLGIGYDQFRKLAKEGKFTSDVVFPALLKSADRMNELFDQMTPTMALGWSRLGVVIQRVFSDVDKALGISATAAVWLRDIAKSIESWRASGGIDRLLAALGSLSDMARLFAAGLAVAFGPTALALIAGFNAALLVTVLRFMLLTGAFIAATLAVEDFWVWLQGGRSLLGTKIGSFEDFKENFFTLLGDMRDRAIEIFALVATAVADFFASLGGWASNAVDAIIAAIMRIPGAVAEMVTSVIGEFNRIPILGGLLSRDPAQQAEQRQRFGGRGAGAGFYSGPAVDPDDPTSSGQGARPNILTEPAPPVRPWSWGDLIPNALRPDWLTPPVTPSAMGGGRGGSVTATQSNTVTNDVRVTITGNGDPATVRGAVEQGMGGARGFASESADAFARQLGMAVPGVEAPTQ
jgi:tape measure domain-containing protein